MANQDLNRPDGGHDAKGGVPAPESSVGKAVGYSDEDPREEVSGADGRRPRKPDQGTPGAPRR